MLQPIRDVFAMVASLSFENITQFPFCYFLTHFDLFVKSREGKAEILPVRSPKLSQKNYRYCCTIVVPFSPRSSVDLMIEGFYSWEFNSEPFTVTLTFLV